MGGCSWNNDLSAIFCAVHSLSSSVGQKPRFKSSCKCVIWTKDLRWLCFSQKTSWNTRKDYYFTGTGRLYSPESTPMMFNNRTALWTAAEGIWYQNRIQLSMNEPVTMRSTAHLQKTPTHCQCTTLWDLISLTFRKAIWADELVPLHDVRMKLQRNLHNIWRYNEERAQS